MFLMSLRSCLKSRRGQNVGQIFVFILALIVFTGILFFGYRAIIGFLDKGEKVAFVQFQNNLEGAVKRVYSQYGSVVVYDQSNPLSVPSKYRQVCFVDLDQDPSSYGSSFGVSHPLAFDAWFTYYEQAENDPNLNPWEVADQNVFLEPVGFNPVNVFRFDLAGEKPFLCFNISSGRLDFMIEGLGDRALIGPLQ